MRNEVTCGGSIGIAHLISVKCRHSIMMVFNLSIHMFSHLITVLRTMEETLK